MILKRNFKRDRRRQKRQLLNTSVHVFTGSAQVDALGINLSDIGMCLFALANLPLGSQIQVEFRPPRCKEVVRLCGTVRHRALYLYGIEFLVDSDHRPGSWADATQLPASALFTPSESVTDPKQLSITDVEIPVALTVVFRAKWLISTVIFGLPVNRLALAHQSSTGECS
jgi:hypothetical protein